MRYLFLSLLLLLQSPGEVVRFAVIGDGGTGKTPQAETAAMMVRYRAEFPFEFVLMLGDNLYGRETPADYQKKFEQPYRALLDSGVRFYASLGNHDDAKQADYQGFNMGGRRYYTFAKGDVRFFALDSNDMNDRQSEWVDRELGRARERWKFCFFHHPLYSSGRKHGSDKELRRILEPLFIKHGVAACFSGHDHFYERIKPQHGIYYFVSGAAGQLRKGDFRSSGLTARGFDLDRHFMLIEVSGETLSYRAVSRAGEIIDSGTISRPMGTDDAKLLQIHEK
jgi:predicted MPP superfamily phosphohydrolase